MTIELIELARPFLFGLNTRRDADAFLSAYDMRVDFDVTDDDPFHAVVEAGEVRSVDRGALDAFSNRDDVSLFGGDAGFRLIFECRATPATAMYYGKVTPRGERAKHNQIAVVLTLLHLAQTPNFLPEL